MDSKPTKPGSSSSINDDDMAASNYQSLKTSIDALKHLITERGFAKIHTDVDKHRLQFKTEPVGAKSTIKDLETSLNSTQDEVKRFGGECEENDHTKDHTKTSDDLRSKIAALESQHKDQMVRNIRLEQYTRREKPLLLGNFNER